MLSRNSFYLRLCQTHSDSNVDVFALGISFLLYSKIFEIYQHQAQISKKMADNSRDYRFIPDAKISPEYPRKKNSRRQEQSLHK